MLIRTSKIEKIKSKELSNVKTFYKSTHSAPGTFQLLRDSNEEEWKNKKTVNIT